MLAKQLAGVPVWQRVGVTYIPPWGPQGLAHPGEHRRSASASVGIRDAAEQIPISSNMCLMLARSQICMKAKLGFFPAR